MGGFSTINGDETIMNADNASFDGTARGGKMTINGELWIGSTASPHVKLGSITSPLGTVSVGYSTPNITLDIAGGAAALEKIAVQTGTSPIVPTGGQITFNGATVAAGTHPVRTDGIGPNTMALEVQISQAIASTDATKIGLSNFDSARFTVDANGFVSVNGAGLGETITGNTGGALSPTTGNWNILGGAGVTTVGSGSTLTVNAVAFTSSGALTMAINSGYFATGAGTYTLPSTSSSGSVVKVICDASGVAITAPGGVTIRIGTLSSSSGGTATSTNVGDSVTLIYRNSTTTWEAESMIGTWIMA